MATFTGVSAECAFSFGRFRLLPGEQILLEDEKPVRLGSRALDILTMLVEHAGELVSRDELTSRVWPDTLRNWVAECNNIGERYTRKNVLFLRWRGERYIPKNVFFLR